MFVDCNQVPVLTKKVCGIDTWLGECKFLWPDTDLPSAVGSWPCNTGFVLHSLACSLQWWRIGLRQYPFRGTMLAEVLPCLQWYLLVAMLSLCKRRSVNFHWEPTLKQIISGRSCTCMIGEMVQSNWLSSLSAGRTRAGGCLKRLYQWNLLLVASFWYIPIGPVYSPGPLEGEE